MKGNARRPVRLRTQRRARSRVRRGKRSNAGFGASPANRLATLIMALAGMVIGASGAIFTGKSEKAWADGEYAITLDLRHAPAVGAGKTGDRRGAIVERILSAGAPHRFQFEDLKARAAPGAVRPKIIIVFDDMGLDKAAFEAALALPGPLTFSFLPYANDVQVLADRARARGDAVMLHLPMEPAGGADPGPHSLTQDLSDQAFLRELEWNLARFSGYVGVNNHMGSKLTSDNGKMKTVLTALKREGLFFVDSLTTGESKLQEAGETVGVPVFVRDVFLDPVAGKEAVRRQLALVERIAQQTGYAVAICHPRRDTIEVLGPWLTSAPARGFELATVTELLEISDNASMELSRLGGS